MSSSVQPSLGSRTVLNSIWNVVPLIWSTLLGLVTIPIVVKAIGIDQFGIYGLFSVLMAPLSLANLGFGEATIKYVAQYARNGDLATASRFIRTTLLFNGLVGLMGAFLIWFAGPSAAYTFFNLPRDQHEILRQCLMLVGATWLVNQISGVFMGVPPAFQNFRLVAWASVVVNTSAAVFGIVFVLLGFGLYGYTAANLLSAIVSMIIWVTAARRLLPSQNLWPGFDLSVWRRAFHFGSWRSLAQLGGLLASQAERFLLGAFLTPAAVGFYNVALNLEQRVYIAVFRMSEVLFPVFSGLERSSQDRMLSMLLRATWLLSAVAVCALIPMIALGPPLLTAWISPEAGTQAGLVLQWLALAGVLGCGSNASSFFLLGSGRTKWTAVLSLATGLTTVILGAAMFPRYGLRAAALPAVAAMIVQQVVLARVILPAVFGPAISLPRLLTAFYGPVCIGLGLALPLARSGAFVGWSLGMLIVTYAVLGIFVGIIVLLVHRFLPGGSTHWQDVRYAVGLISRPILKARQAICVA